MLYHAGAKEIHLRVSVRNKAPDYYGIDTPNKRLIAANLSVDEIAKQVGVKSLKFLSIQGLYRALGYKDRNDRNPQFTDHCFTGDYPVKPTDNKNLIDKNNQLSLLSNVRS